MPVTHIHSQHKQRRPTEIARKREENNNNNHARKKIRNRLLVTSTISSINGVKISMNFSCKTVKLLVYCSLFIADSKCISIDDRTLYLTDFEIIYFDFEFFFSSLRSPCIFYLLSDTSKSVWEKKLISRSRHMGYCDEYISSITIKINNLLLNCD